MKDNFYPTTLILKNDINNGLASDFIDKNKFYESNDAIELILKIDNSNYSKKQVQEAIKEICQKAVEYYY